MEKIHVAIALDDNYAECSMVLMTSILLNKANDEELYFHILDGGLSENVKSMLLATGDCNIEIHKINLEDFKWYKKSDYYPVSMLLTLVLPDIVKLDKVIYFDGDIVVNSSLKELWNTEFEDNYVLAVEDANGKKYVKKYGLNPVSKFFNSGVMLINCNKWKADNITEIAVKLAMKHTGTPLGYDQTILNKLFEGAVKFLDLKWNLQYCPFNVWATYSDKEQYAAAIENPSVIHYVGDFKPWKSGLGCFNPKQDDFLKYHKCSAYGLEDYKNWKRVDKLSAFKGLWAFIKRYPAFYLRKQFWINLFMNFCS